MGKTTLAFSMARSCRSRVIFDPRCQFTSDRPETIVVHTAHEIPDAFDALYSTADGKQELIIAPRQHAQSSFDAMMRQVAEWSQDEQRLPLAVLIDEVTFVDVMESEDFEWTVRAAPRRTIHLILTGHRPKDIDVNVRALADEWLMFKIVQKHDLEVIGERCGEVVADQVSILDPFWFMQWDDAHGQAYKHPPLTEYVAVAPPQGPTAEQLAIGKGILVQRAQSRLI
jgi:hypothetical protein